MSDQKNQQGSFMSNLNTSTILATGVPLVLVAGVGFYFYRQNSAHVSRIQLLEQKLQEMEAKMKMMEDIIHKQKDQLDVVVQNWQQAFGSIQSQMASMNQPQPKYRAQAPPPPQYSPDDDEFEEAPPQIKKKVKGISQSSPSIKEQAAAMERERGGS